MKGVTFFTSDSNNSYVFSKNLKHFTVSHPLLAFFAQQDEKQLNLSELSKKDEIVIDNNIYKQDEIQYYCKKYQHLKQSGFFDEIATKKVLSRKITAKEVEMQLNNSSSLTFEVTEKCNLHCNYCCYGEAYDKHGDRNYTNLDFTKAKILIDFLLPKWQQFNSNKKIFIGFYGGEALLNFGLVESITEYILQIAKKHHLRFQFIMTTNGILIHKYLDFLIKHDFWLTISLDGNEEHNKHRVFHDGSPSYPILYKNIKHIQSNYPSFFEANIEFSAVLQIGRASCRERV